MRWFQGMEIDPNTQTTICCGTTEAMISSLLATIDPGDEVIVTSPFYENYGADTILCGATPRYVTLHPTESGGFEFDPDELRKAFNNKTRGIIVNTPNNPTGKVYSREDLSLIAELCIRHDVLAFTDEIYEHILYEGREHIARPRSPRPSEPSTSNPADGRNPCRDDHKMTAAVAAPPRRQSGAGAARRPSESHAPCVSRP